MTRVITVTSGKGGVGKTNVSANLALHLAELGYSTCLFDADLGLANINILLKIYPEYNLKDVILSRRDIRDIVIQNYEGIDIIPGSSGVEEMANLRADQITDLIREFSKLDTYDYFIIDTAAGISRDVISFCLASSELIVIITPDPTSLTDAYSLLKILSLNGFNNSVMAVINQSPGLQSAKNALGKFIATTTKYLGLKIIPIGVIGRDQNVISAVARQRPFIMLYPNTSASKSIKNIARNLIKKEDEDLITLDMESFWVRCLNFFTRTLRTGIRKSNRPQSYISDKDRPDPFLARPSDLSSNSSVEMMPEKIDEKMDEVSKIDKRTDEISDSLRGIGIPQEIITPARSEITSEDEEPSSDPEEEKSVVSGNRETEQVVELPDLVPQLQAIGNSGIPSPDTLNLISQTNQLLTQVAQSIASVASELKEIREIFAKTRNEFPNGTGAELLTEKKKENTSEKNREQLASVLANFSMFQALDDHDIKSIVEQLHFLEYHPGDIVIRKGEPGKNLFIIVSGKVEVVDDNGAVLDTMENGDVFGEMSLISGDPVNATIKVIETSGILYLNGKEFISMLRTYPALQMYFARLLSKRLTNRLKKADMAKEEYLKSGLTGSIAETNITELLQMLNMGKKTGMITFRFARANGSLSFNDGEIVSAQYNQISDMDAFYRILAENEGRFTYISELPGRDAGKAPMGHFMKLLMEGISRIDEEQES